MNKNIHNSNQPEERRELGEELKAVFLVISPFIEKHVSVVCPDCTNLCCKDKHGRYDKNDIIFLTALGVYVPQVNAGREETGPCRYMIDTGCSLTRWMRPYRCTFFFCDQLLKSMENDNSKLYRAFRMYLEQLVFTRQKLLD